MKKKWKALTYVIAGARVCTEKQPRLTLTTDEGRILEGRSIIFGNGRKYGGRLTSLLKRTTVTAFWTQ